ncbi:hypothetical protein B7463_g10497, partial [Scytalidium lignicola]
MGEFTMKTKVVIKHSACGHKTSDYDGIGKSSNGSSVKPVTNANLEAKASRWRSAVQVVMERVSRRRRRSTETIEVIGFCQRCLRRAKDGKTPKLDEDFLKTLTPEQRKRVREDPLHFAVVEWTRGEAMDVDFHDVERNKRRVEMMKTFLCNSCEAEHHIVTPESRAANQGLCCKDGLRDFLEVFMMREFVRKRCGGAAEARRADSATDTDTHTHTPHRSEPGILWEQWKQYTRTHHGLYPPPDAAAPDKPLPAVPSDDGQVSTTIAASSVQQPILHQPMPCRPNRILDNVIFSDEYISSFPPSYN